MQIEQWLYPGRTGAEYNNRTESKYNRQETYALSKMAGCIAQQ
jgi:hypothetical protein